MWLKSWQSGLCSPQGQRAGPAGLHAGRAGALGRTPGAGLPDLGHGLEPAGCSRAAPALPFPWLISSEWLHYGYALVMLAGLLLLRPGFTGRAPHLVDRSAGHPVLAPHRAPTAPDPVAHRSVSARQAGADEHRAAGLPRVELHLFYNAVVFLPMVVAMYCHMYRRRERPSTCTAPARSSPASPPWREGRCAGSLERTGSGFGCWDPSCAGATRGR